VHGANDQFLARACLAIDQHCGVGWRDCLNFAQDKLQSPAVSDDVLEMKLASDLAESKGAGMEFLKRTSAFSRCQFAALSARIKSFILRLISGHIGSYAARVLPPSADSPGSCLVWARGCKIASLLLKHVVIFLDKLS
jgi:hypothetical protein